MTQPLCSVAFRPLHHYYGAIRPCALHWYSVPPGVRPIGVLVMEDDGAQDEKEDKAVLHGWFLGLQICAVLNKPGLHLR